MAESHTPEEARYIRDLAMLDFIKTKKQIEALPYDGNYTDDEKEAITKYLKNQQIISQSIINKPLNTTTHAHKDSIQTHRE